MEITLKNTELPVAINFLQNMNLKAADSRHRSKLVKLLVEAYEEFGIEEKNLMKKFDLLDVEGNLIEESKRDLENVRKYNQEQKILAIEEVVIQGGMFSKNIEQMQRVLTQYDGELSGEEAEIYDRLLDEFEKNTKGSAE